ncbi:MAG: LysR family transcriptional regulator [Shimia sp.]
MENWDDLRFLVAVAKTGTMTGAAKSLGTNTATVSRRLDRLGQVLGQSPFVKTSNGWVPSEPARALIDLATDFEGHLTSELNAPGAEAEMVALRIGCPPIVSTEVLFPGLMRFEGTLEGMSLTFTDRIFEEGLADNDIVIRFGAPESGRLVTKRVGEIGFGLFCFCDDACRNQRRWVGLTGDHANYPPMQAAALVFGGPPSVQVGTFQALFHLMQKSRLPGPLPKLLAVRSGDLREMASPLPPFRAEFWVCYHESRRGDAAISRAVRWIERCFAAAAEVEAQLDAPLPMQAAAP